MKKLLCFIFITLMILIAGCAGSKTAILYSKKASHPIKTIALASTSLGENGKVLTELFKTELSQHGFNVLFDDNYAFATTEEILKLKKDGIDAYVVVKGYWLTSTSLHTIDVVSRSTHSGEKIVKIKWRNSWGGGPGSPMDNSMRKSTKVAVKEVVYTLTKYLQN